MKGDGDIGQRRADRPRPLARLLPEHDIRTVAVMGWAGKRNGEHFRATSARSRKRLTLAVTDRSEQGEPRSGALRGWAAPLPTVYCLS